MKSLRQWFFALILAPLTLIAWPLTAWAQDGRTIEWVVGYAAGGGSDVVARTLAEHIGKSLVRPIVITNKPGAATNIAAEYVARSKGTGNVIFTADFATLAANPTLFTKLAYDVQKDFAPVGLIARFPMLLVVAPGVPASSYQELEAWVRSRAEGVTYASAGPGSPHHLTAELLRERTGMKLVHVPYRGASPAINDLLGGQVSMGMMDTATAQQYIHSGRLKALAVASLSRLKTLPDVPTLDEMGVKGFEAYAWQGLVVPAGTPSTQVWQLNRALVSALEAAPVKARLQALGLETLPGTPEEMARYARSERARWGELIRTAGIRLD